MVALSDLVAQVDDELHGNTSDLEQRTTLTQNIGTTDVQFSVTDASQISTGVVQIDQETMWVKTVDRNANVVYLDNSTWARGFRGSTTASHTSGAAVINNPRFPSEAVVRAIQQVNRAIYPSIFQVKMDETQTAKPARISYQVPADCDIVRDVSWRTTGPSELWKPVQRWRFRPQADTTDFPTGKAIDIADPIVPGRIIKVSYIAAPGVLTALTDTLASVGLSDGLADVLVYGACYRLLTGVEAARLQTFSVTQSARDGLVPAGAAANASKYYFALYQQRLHDEEMSLQKKYPASIHKTR